MERQRGERREANTESETYAAGRRTGEEAIMERNGSKTLMALAAAAVLNEEAQPCACEAASAREEGAERRRKS
eukprot:5800012-Pleurochrysis_carterae.AAC.1